MGIKRNSRFQSVLYSYCYSTTITGSPLLLAFVHQANIQWPSQVRHVSPRTM